MGLASFYTEGYDLPRVMNLYSPYAVGKALYIYVFINLFPHASVGF